MTKLKQVLSHVNAPMQPVGFQDHLTRLPGSPVALTLQGHWGLCLDLSQNRQSQWPEQD